MQNGYEIWRRSIGALPWGDEGLWKVWSWCLLKASSKVRFESVSTGRGKTQVLLRPGQFVYQRGSAAEELGMAPSSVRNRMEKLIGGEFLDNQVDNQYSIITICGWESYNGDLKKVGQEVGQPKDNQRTTKGQPKAKEKPVKVGPPKEDVLAVFDAYRKFHPRSHKTPVDGSAEWKLIAARLLEGYSVDDLASAISGCHKTPHNMGLNERGTKYLHLSLIMRDGSHVARFIENDANPPILSRSEREQKSLFAVEDWANQQLGGDRA